MGCGRKTVLHRGYYETSESLVRLLLASVGQLSSTSFCVPVSLCDNARGIPRTVTTYGHFGSLFSVFNAYPEHESQRRQCLSEAEPRRSRMLSETRNEQNS